MNFDSGAAQARMVSEQLRGRGIRDENVLRAMRQVPRALFVPAASRPMAYSDHPLPLPAGQTISQPYIVAYMLAALNLKADERALEIGTGSGYVLALLSRLCAEAYGAERHPTLVEYARQRLRHLKYDNVALRGGDGTAGWAKHAPYDAILVSAGGPRVPPPLKQQLAPAGRLVMPVGTRPHKQTLIRVTRQERDEYRYERLCGVAFVPLVGAAGWSEEET